MRELVLSFLLSTAALAPGEAQVLYTFKVGDTLAYQSDLRMQARMSSSQPVGPQAMSVTVNATIKVARMVADSITLWFDSLRVSSDLPTGATGFDQLIGQKVTLPWSERGEPPRAALSGPAASMRGMFQSMATLFPRLPAGGVLRGASWSDTLQLDPAPTPGVSVKGQGITKYTVTRDTVVDGETGFVIEASGSSEVTTESSRPEAQLTGTQASATRSTIVLLRNGVLLSVRTHTTGTGKTSVNAPMAMAMDVRTEVESYMRLIRR